MFPTQKPSIGNLNPEPGSFQILSGIYISLACLLLTLLYFFLRRDPRINYYLGKFSGPSELPVLGHLHHFVLPRYKYLPLLCKWSLEYHPMGKFWLGPWLPHVGICDPVIIEKILGATSHINKGKHAYDPIHSWLGEGLLTSSRSKWFVRRKLLTPSFHFKILEDFVPIFNEQASILVECLEKNVTSGVSETFDIYPYITKCTLDVICETAMGKKINAQTSSDNKIYIDSVNGLVTFRRYTEVISDRIIAPWKGLPIIKHILGTPTREKKYLKILHQFTDQIIQAKKAEATTKNKSEPEDVHEANLYYGKKRKAFLDLLLEYSDSGHILSDLDIREEVDTFMFEGHDTTGVNLGWVILLLAANQNAQALVQEELDSIFEDDLERDVTTGDVAKMKYLECCIKETLRLYPSVPFIVREIDEDIVIDAGRILPKGVAAIIPIYCVHRNPKYFSDPFTFKPERFIDDKGVQRHPFAYIPFSAGPRNCIGQKFALLEEKIILAKLFRQFRFEAGVKDVEKVIAEPDLVLRSRDGIHVKLFNRM